MSNYLKLFKAEFDKYAAPYKGRPSKQTAAPAAPAAPAATPAQAPIPEVDQPAQTFIGPPKPPELAPGGRAPHRGLRTTSPAAKAGLVYSVPLIKEMQTALVNLADAVRLELQPKTSAGPKGQQSAVSHTSFGDFIVQHYLRKSPVEGSEFGSEVRPNKMSNIMDTISRVGSTKNDFTIDGNWGPKTNQALHDVNAFAFSMLKLAQDFGITIKSYSQAALSAFKVPEKDTDLSIAQKAAQAPIMTKHINAIAKMFGEIKVNILEHPQHKAYIDGAQAYMTFKKVEPLSEQDKHWQETWTKQRNPSDSVPFNVEQPGGNGTLLGASINYSDLVSLQNFNAWLSGPEAKQLKQPGVTQPMILAAIRKALVGKSTPPAPAQTPAPTPGAA